MKNRFVRDSNYELLRLLAMIAIVLWHVIQKGLVIENTSGVTKTFFTMVMFFVIAHVNVFMLITGYYQSKTKFKLKKVISYMFQFWFYNILITTILSSLKLIDIDYSDFIISSSFFDLNEHWYFKFFIILYAISPFFNKFIDTIDKKMFKRCLVVLILCFSIWPFFTGGLAYHSIGFSLEQFTMMYFIGAYIRKYDLGSNMLSKFNLPQKRIIYILIFLFSWIVNVSLYYFFNYLGTIDNKLCLTIYKYANINKYSYCNPLIIIQAVSIFMLFDTINIKSRIINFLSSLTLGVYMIHENKFLKVNAYRWLKIDIGMHLWGYSIVPKVFIVTIIIYITCSIIEFLRKILFKLLNMIPIVKKSSLKFEETIHKILEIV